MTSSCSEGPDCPSRATAPPYSRSWPRYPAKGTPRWLTFTLVDHRWNGRAHPHLQVSVENAEEAELSSGGGPGRRGCEGEESRLRPEGHTWREARQIHCAGVACRIIFWLLPVSFPSRKWKTLQVQIVTSASQSRAFYKPEGNSVK